MDITFPLYLGICALELWEFSERTLPSFLKFIFPMLNVIKALSFQASHMPSWHSVNAPRHAQGMFDVSPS